MSRILILADPGFGKSTSLGEIKELKIKGLDPTKTLIISCSDKALPFPGWKTNYKHVNGSGNGNFLMTNEPNVIIKTIDYFLANRPDIENYVIDDINFIMQDYYMDNAKNKGYTTFQNIGYDFGQLFKKFSAINKKGKNIIVLGHPESYEENGQTKFRLKTVGNMVNQYVTPMGKFEVVLMGKEEFNERTQQVTKYFVTGYDGNVKGKIPYGMFDDLYIPNDVGYVLEKVKEYELKN